MMHPDFFTSGTMNELTIQQMMTFAGIWCWADDYGRGEDDETLVKATVWPRRKSITDRKVRADMDALTVRDVLCKYEVNGVRLIHVVNWKEHQKVSHPTDSKLAPCPKHEHGQWAEFANGTFPAMQRFANDSRITPDGLRSVS